MSKITRMPPPNGRIGKLKDYLDRLQVAKREVDTPPPTELEAFHITLHAHMKYGIDEAGRLLRQLGGEKL